MNHDEGMNDALRALPTADLDHVGAERLRRRARQVFERAHRTPGWLRGLDLAWDRAEPALVAASTLWMLGWAAGVVRLIVGG